MIKKSLITIIFFLSTFFALTYTLAFTNTGNNLTRPLIENYIQKNYSKDLKLKTFELKQDRLSAKLVYKNLIEFDIFGDIVFLDQKLDLRINFKSINFKNNFIGSGSISGDFLNFNTHIDSNIAGGDSTLNINIKNLKPQSLDLRSKGLRSNDLKEIFGLNPIISGIFDAVLNLRQLEPTINGDFKISSNRLKFTRKPTNIASFREIIQENFKAMIEGQIVDAKINAKGNVKSKIYDLDLLEINGGFRKIGLNYELKIPSIKPINKDIKDDFMIFGSGDFSYDFVNSMSSWTFSTISFGGLSEASSEQNIKISLQNNDLSKLLGFLKAKELFVGSLSGEANYLLNIKSGDFVGEIQNLSIGKNDFFDLIHEYNGFDISKQNFERVPIKITIKNNDLKINTNLENDNFAIKLKNGAFNLQNQKINLPLILKIGTSGIKFSLQGDISKPKPNFDLQDILQLDRLK